MQLPSKEKSQESVLVICLGLLVLFIWTKNMLFFWIAFGVLAAAVLSGFVARWIAWLWFKLAHVLGRINGSILLSIIFFLLLTPIAWLMRLFKGNSLQLRKKTETDASYFKNRDHVYQPRDLEHPW